MSNLVFNFQALAIINYIMAKLIHLSLICFAHNIKYIMLDTSQNHNLGTLI